ncbi:MULTISPECIES: SpoIIE family protein phosphatase [Kitasatospora]|uniref:PPM-type phosphatase domain-containing protein n=1 Tax=Kitasatospora cystarginea TaxID=58350 RepID=A0ABP5RK30_9ACTN
MAGISRSSFRTTANSCWYRRLDIATGHLQWVNAGHPAPLLIRDHRVIQTLDFLVEWRGGTADHLANPDL